ncbi:hypothetical protein V6Z11_A03G136400 [Gossypium hirsutum]
MIETFCDICIKEILKGNSPGTHFTKDGWLKIMINFEKETGKAFSQRQLKNRTSGIDPEFEGKLDQMFMGIVATGDKAWAPSSADNMSQATSSLTPVMDPYGIPQAVKVLDSMSEEVPEASPLYFFTLRLLLNKDKRIMFLSINPKIRALWLKTEMEDS